MDAFKKKRPNGNTTTTTTAKPRPQQRSTTASSSKPAAAPDESSPYFSKAETVEQSTNPLTATGTTSTTLQIIESTGDIFSAPINTLLIHACNCQASWAAGIAKAFKQNCPEAFPKYAAYCKKWTPDQLFGTAFLIAPSDDAFSAATTKETADGDDEGFAEADDDDEPGDPATHFVGCLFTSHHYGKRKDSPTKILAATKPAMEDLLRKVQEWNESVDEGKRIKEVRMCKINSGLFNVPWEKTRQVLEGIEVGKSGVEVVKVVSLEE